MRRAVLLAAVLLPGVAAGVLGGDSEGARSAARRPPARIPFRGGPERIVATGSMSAPRAAHTATLLPDGRVLVTGGLGSGGTTEIYDPSAMSFSPGPPLLQPRAGSHTATLLPDGRVLIAGGWQDGRPLATTEIYDPAANRFFPGPRMTTLRAEHTATLLPDGRVLMAAGVAAGYDQPFLRSAEIYDPAAGGFLATGSLVTPRRAHIANLLPDGRVLVTGGSSARGNVLSSAEIYDPGTRSFAPAGPLTTARYKHAGLALSDGRILVFGGSDARDDVGRYASTEIFDPQENGFFPGALMSEARYKLQDAVAALSGGEVLVAGGGDLAEVYDPKSGVFREVEGSLGDGRLFMTATALRNGAVLLAGGYGYHSNLTAQAWIYLPQGSP